MKKKVKKYKEKLKNILLQLLLISILQLFIDKIILIIRKIVKEGNNYTYVNL